MAPWMVELWDWMLGELKACWSGELWGQRREIK